MFRNRCAQEALCTGTVMYRERRGQEECLGFRMFFRMFRVQDVSKGFRMFRVQDVQGLGCLGFRRCTWTKIAFTAKHSQTSVSSSCAVSQFHQVALCCLTAHCNALRNPLTFETQVVLDTSCYRHKMLQTEVVLDRRCCRQKLFQTQVVIDRSCYRQKLFQTEVILDKSCSRQKVVDRS